MPYEDIQTQIDSMPGLALRDAYDKLEPLVLGNRITNTLMDTIARELRAVCDTLVNAKSIYDYRVVCDCSLNTVACLEEPHVHAQVDYHENIYDERIKRCMLTWPKSACVVGNVAIYWTATGEH